MHGISPVAVIIVNWNSGGDLQKCLAALMNQTRPAEEVIVVDNASSDDSLSGVAEKFPDVRLIRLSANTGFAHANNLGAREVEACDWIAFLNPDAFAEPEWLENLFRGATDHSRFSFFGSHMLRYGTADELDGTGDVFHVSGLAWRRDHGLKASATKRVTGEIFSPCAAAAMIRKDVFIGTGGFDESFHSYFEDVDLGFRIRLMGHRCLYVADAVVLHVGSGATHRTSDYSVYHGNRNLVWAYVKNMPGILFWLYLPQHLLANVAAVVWYMIQGKGQVILRAKWHALMGLPMALAKRKNLQVLRRVGNREISRVLVKGWFLPYSKKKRAV